MNHPGGSIKAHAGDAYGVSQKGGDIEVSAGTSSHSSSSGSGGSIRISAGHAAGLSKDGMNDGGDIQIVSGSSTEGVSGSVLFQSGFSEGASSGEIGEITSNYLKIKLLNEFPLPIKLTFNSVITTSNAGKRGETGFIELKTGVSSEGPSGDIKISSGDAHIGNAALRSANTGRGGSIYISVGVGDEGDGGDVKILSGSTTATSSFDASYTPSTTTGGSIELSSGVSQAASSGEISITTADAGMSGMSGYIRVKTGEATSGMAGYIGELGSNWIILPSNIILISVKIITNKVSLVAILQTEKVGRLSSWQEDQQR